MDTNLIANLGTMWLSNKLGGDDSKTTGTTPTTNAINIPNTIVGNLANVVNTKSYMESYARYNNYLTSSYGAAQMASDRYMSLKERIPMSIEYYQTPTQKKEIVMYVNPEKMSLATTKVKQKVYTRGGIYFHHYGDDIWTMKINGTVGYAQMKGIEALEEAYHYSGALLKYQNISASTVHTNQITNMADSNSDSEISSLLDKLKNSDSSISKYLGKVIGTATDALGMTKNSNSDYKTIGEKLFGKETSSGKSNSNLFDALNNASGNLTDCFSNSLKESSSVTGILDSMKTAEGLTGNATNFSGMFKQIGQNLKNGMSTTSPSILSGLAADITMNLTGSGQGNNMGNILGQLGSGVGNTITSALQMLTGDFSGAAKTSMPMSATSGNYYSLGQMTSTELNNIVGTVQSFNKSRQIDKESATKNWSDIEEQLTDLYRPRQVFIYFDDRVYIGHFDSFSWTRTAATLLINYDMQFTVTRQVVIGRQELGKSSSGGGGTSLKGLLGTALASGIMGGIFGGKTDKKENDTVNPTPPPPDLSKK